MKKSMLVLLVAALTIGSVDAIFGQEQLSHLIAVFNGNQSSLEKEVQSKIISFALKNQDENSRADFENKALDYSKLFTVYVPSVRESTTMQSYVVTLHNNTEFKMLNRLFVASNINQVEFNGAKMSREDFFKPYMK